MMRAAKFLSAPGLIAASLLAGCAHLAPSLPLDVSRHAEIDNAIESFIARQLLPGAVFRVERDGAFYQKAYGKHTFETDATTVTLDTVFDVASLTKVIATAPAVMLLVEEGKVALDVPLIQYLPQCTGGDKESITVRHLLTHTSGLAAGLPAKPPWRGEESALTLACEQLVTHPPGSYFRYSDINFTLLGLLVQRVGGLPLNDFVAQRLYAPMRMHDTGYLPLKRIPAARIAPTQAPTQKMVDGTVQSLTGDLPDGQALQGAVHDPTVRRMGGVGGSAGVFTTLADVARLARMLLNEGELDGVRVLSRDSVRLMSTVQSPSDIEWRRSAGWDIDSPYSRPRGSVFPIGSYGHTGFTGCILWIDPFSKTFYVFLSNRVYPNDKANILDLYARLGTASAQMVQGFDFKQVAGALPAKSAAIVPLSPTPSASPTPH